MLSPEQKEMVLRMILRLKKKRKVQRVEPKLEIGGEPSQYFITNVEGLDYRAQSEEIRAKLQAIVKNS